jgi:hypothetical protein
VSSPIVVRFGLPRTAPRKPRSRISRSIVQRATRMPSRFSCAQTLSAPYAPKFSAWTRVIAGFSTASRRRNADTGRDFDA